MKAVAILCALALSGCASVPVHVPWSVSNPKDRMGWSAPQGCFNVCRPSAGLVKVRYRVAF
jgi:hypothetical protein